MSGSASTRDTRYQVHSVEFFFGRVEPSRIVYQVLGDDVLMCIVNLRAQQPCDDNIRCRDVIDPRSTHFVSESASTRDTRYQVHSSRVNFGKVETSRTWRWCTGRCIVYLRTPQPCHDNIRWRDIMNPRSTYFVSGSASTRDTRYQVHSTSYLLVKLSQVISYTWRYGVLMMVYRTRYIYAHSSRATI